MVQVQQTRTVKKRPSLLQIIGAGDRPAHLDPPAKGKEPAAVPSSSNNLCRCLDALDR